MSEIKVTSLKATLNGEEIVIEKLKAGKYYEAQSIYVAMIDTVRRKPNKKEKTSSEDSKDEEKVSSFDVSGLYATFPKEVAKLVSFCIGIDVDKLLEDAYPEEMTEIASKVIELNNFNENLKNSVAPLENLGANKN